MSERAFYRLSTRASWFFAALVAVSVPAFAAAGVGSDGVSPQQATIATSPPNPTANVPFTFNVSGQWPNSCFPRFSSLSVSGSTITIEGRANETCSSCFFVVTDYSFSSTQLTLAVGTYRVEFFVTDCTVRSLRGSRDLTISPPTPIPTITFNASPQTIQAGESSTLTWTTMNATAVTIDKGLGSQPITGSATVRPGMTTTYTLTATGPGGTSMARTTVFVTPGLVPIVSITRFPAGMVQTAGQSGATDQYALTNLGRAPTTITLTQSGAFFSQSPSSFQLPAGATQVVSIVANQQQAGSFDGMSIPSGNGVPVGLSILIRLLSATPPAGNIAPAASSTRPEIAAPPNQNSSGSVDFTNTGAGVLQGIAVSDVSWLIPQRDVVIIPPGQTRNVTFTTDRSLRPDAATLLGAAVGKLSLVYLDSTVSSGLRASADGPSKAAFSISIVDAVTPGVAPGTPPPLGAGELALFAPGLPQRVGAVSDLLLSNIGAPISDLRLYLFRSGSASLVSALGQFGPNTGVAFVSALKNIFAASGTGGTVQARSVETSRVAVASIQTNTTNKIGSYITALPTFRSDRFVAAGQALHLPGVEKNSARVTNLFVQELAGVAGSVQIDFLDAMGTVLSSRPADSIASFGLIALDDVVPAGAGAVRVRNTSTTGARINAFAVVTDLVTQDGFVITDSGVGSTAGTAVLVPLFGSTSKTLTASSAVFIMNTAATPMEVTIDSRPGTAARRRSVRSASDSTAPISEQSVSIRNVAPLQTIQINEPGFDGYLRISASGPFAVAGRTTLTGAGRFGTFGGALAAAGANLAVSNGQLRRFSSVDDSSSRTTDAATPVTYRSSFALLESSGRPAVVRLTLRYVFSAGTLVTATGQDSLDVPVPANQLVLIGDLSRSVIGSKREGYGDLRNMQLDVEVSGDGSIIPFLRTIDNGSGDPAIRTE